MAPYSPVEEYTAPVAFGRIIDGVIKSGKANLHR